jgi:hypothetical protein
MKKSASSKLFNDRQLNKTRPVNQENNKVNPNNKTTSSNPKAQISNQNQTVKRR